MNRFDIYSKRLIWSGAFLLTAFVAGCGGGGGGGGGPTAGIKAGPAYYDMGAAAPFGAGSGNGVHNQGTATVVTGDLGTTAGHASITGFHDSTGAPPYAETAANVGAVSGTIFTSVDPPGDFGNTGKNVADALNAAYTALSDTTLTTGTEPNATTPGMLGGVTLASGIYTSPTLQITGGDLTLDAKGNPNAFWVFQSNTLTVGDATPQSVTLANGALAKNVFWRIRDNATINAAGGGTMAGTIITSSGLNIGGGAATTALNGRAFVFGPSAVNMVNTVITTPAP